MTAQAGGEAPIARVEGNIQGIRPSRLKVLSRLYARRYPISGYNPEQARELAALSRDLGRQLGLLTDRQGRPQMVLVGDFTSILIPELPRSREGAGRLRGLRFLHTHLTPDLLSQEDLMDMLFLRLDAVVALVVDEHGKPQRVQRAHLMPPNPENLPYMLYPAEHWDSLRADFTAEALALEEELARAWSEGDALVDGRGLEGRRAGQGPLRAGIIGHDTGKGPESRAVLISVSSEPAQAQESALAELAELARSAGICIAGVMRKRVRQVNPRNILGKGGLAELEVLALRGNAGLIVFDGELSPAHLGNLAEITERRVLDRTQLILDIFAQRARSRAGKFQVELAQLQYMLPRLIGKSRALDRLAGGIGGRGPGESKLETDRRRLRDRVARIKASLKDLRRQRAFVRARRGKSGTPTASLVGYTNAGKSTLLNVLTGSDATAEKRLFATLDPTTRRLRFPKEKELILTDTVGFIRSLPKELLEAFRATLEELEEADMLLHVADASHPELEQQLKAVDDILEQLGLTGTPRILILNKIDALDESRDDADPAAPGRRQLLEQTHPGAFLISARTGEGLADLAAAVAGRIESLKIENALAAQARSAAARPTGAGETCFRR